MSADSKIKIALYLPTTDIGRLIVRYSRDRYAHVEFLLPDGSTVGATMKEGVRKIKHPALEHVDVYDLPNITQRQSDELITMIERDVRMKLKYDTPGLLRFITKRTARADMDFFCSEYVVQRLMDVQFYLFNRHVTPELVDPGKIAWSKEVVLYSQALETGDTECPSSHK